MAEIRKLYIFETLLTFFLFILDRLIHGKMNLAEIIVKAKKMQLIVPRINELKKDVEY